jgi:LCP family protein required for cell wall assembly
MYSARYPRRRQGVIPQRDGLKWRPGVPRQPSLLRRLGILVLPFMVSGLIGFLAYFIPVAQVAVAQTGQQLKNGALLPQVAAGSSFTVLLLGSDDDTKFQGSPLTQSMILVRVDPAANKVAMLSIPRDLWVDLSTGGKGKIDEAYEHGGPDSAIQTVENNFHVQINEWAWIGLTGLVKVVDQVGGIDISPTNAVLDDAYPNDIGTKNPYSLGRVAVLPGAQHLDGMQALQYVRSRHDDIREDFGRSFRQQQVLIALRSSAKSLNPADLPAIMDSLKGQFKTSMSVERMRDLLPLAQHIQPDSIHQVVLVGNYTRNGYMNGQDVLIPNWAAIQDTLHQSFPSL